MGQSLNKDQSFNIKYWMQVDDPKNALFPSINIHRTRLLLNTVTHQYIEEYNIHFVSFEDFQSYIAEIEWRRENASPGPQIQIFPVKYFRDTSTTQLCSTIYSGSIYFEKIEMRLKEINDIPYNDSLYLMQAALQGFSILYKMYGPFQIRQDMIFINNSGEVKVWVNNNPSNNTPHNRQATEASMIRAFLSMVEQNIDNEYKMELFFSEYLSKKQMLDDCTFDDVIHQLHSFCQLLRVSIPSEMKSVSDLFDTRVDTEQSLIESHGNKNSQKSRDFHFGDQSAKKLAFINESLDFQLHEKRKEDEREPQRSSRMSGVNNFNSQNQIKKEIIYSQPNQDKNIENFRTNSHHLYPSNMTPSEMYRTKRSNAVKEKPFTPNEKVPQERKEFSNEYYPEKSQKVYRNSFKVNFPTISPNLRQQKFIEQKDPMINARMCSAEPRVPLPIQPPSNYNSSNNHSFSSRVNFVPQHNLNKTGQYRNSNKVSKENIKFHYVSNLNDFVPQKSEVESYTVKPTSVNIKIHNREKKGHFFMEQNRRKSNKSGIQKKYYTSNESYELDSEIAADLQKILKEGGF